jgi:5-methyltetrahydrofolate--homocysteine methyltransferase
METRVISPQGQEVFIGNNRPVVLIGERINPFGRGPLKEAMKSGDMEPIRAEAINQVEAGADILMVSTAAFGLDETVVLPQVTEAILKTVDVPLCLESRNPLALEKTLQLGCGKPIISSVTGEETLLEQILPLAKKYRTALVLLASDTSGLPTQAEKRVEIITRLIEKAQESGIDLENLIADCVAESSAVNPLAAMITLETMRKARELWKLNLILGASNVSFGLPRRSVINAVFLSLAIQAGLTSAIVNAKRMKPFILAADLMMGRDHRARRYTTYCRKLNSVSTH